MKFWKVDDLKHENEHIHYNKRYSGNVYVGDKIYPILFRVEKDVFGERIEDLEIIGDPDYPVIELKDKIRNFLRSQL